MLFPLFSICESALYRSKEETNDEIVRKTKKATVFDIGHTQPLTHEHNLLYVHLLAMRKLGLRID